MADLSKDTLDFLKGVEAQLESELSDLDRQMEERRKDIQEKLLAAHQAIDAIGKLGGLQPFKPVIVRRRAASASKPVSERDPEWHEKLANLNQREALVAIAKIYGGKLDTDVAASVMREAGKLQGKFLKNASEARSRVAYLARSSGRFTEQDNRHFVLAA